MLDHKFFREVGTKVRDSYRTHIFTKALDVNDKKFKGYREPYKSLKSKGKLKRQWSGSTGTTAPVVTQGLALDFGTIYKTSEAGISMGWSSKGEVVKKLNKTGRVLTSKAQPLPKGIIKELMKDVEVFVDKKLKKIIPKSRKYKVGKK